MPRTGVNKAPANLNNRQNLTSRHRLRGFDYRNPGYYFITICIQERIHLLGQVNGGEIALTSGGEMVSQIIQEIPGVFPGIELDSFAVMPNHIHVLFYVSLESEEHSASDIVRWIKGVSANRYRLGVLDDGWQRYSGRLWQRGFNDQIIRNDKHLAEVRRYIAENPEKWEFDELYSR